MQAPKCQPNKRNQQALGLSGHQHALANNLPKRRGVHRHADKTKKTRQDKTNEKKKAE
jgi:hypothetical protein